MKRHQFLMSFSKCAVLGTLLMLVNIVATQAQTREQMIAQYCNANDQGLISWLQQNGSSMPQQQLAATAVQISTQLSPPCQSLMRWFDEIQPSGVAQTVRPGECTRHQQQAMIAWNNQAGPHRIRTDCWNF